MKEPTQRDYQLLEKFKFELEQMKQPEHGVDRRFNQGFNQGLSDAYYALCAQMGFTVGIR